MVWCVPVHMKKAEKDLIYDISGRAFVQHLQNQGSLPLSDVFCTTQEMYHKSSDAFVQRTVHGF